MLPVKTNLPVSSKGRSLLIQARNVPGAEEREEDRPAALKNLAAALATRQVGMEDAEGAKERVEAREALITSRGVEGLREEEDLDLGPELEVLPEMIENRPDPQQAIARGLINTGGQGQPTMLPLSSKHLSHLGELLHQ